MGDDGTFASTTFRAHETEVVLGSREEFCMTYSGRLAYGERSKRSPPASSALALCTLRRTRWSSRSRVTRARTGVPATSRARRATTARPP